MAALVPYAWLIFPTPAFSAGWYFGRALAWPTGANRRATATFTIFKGLFAEVRYDAALDLIRLVRSFSDTAPLAEYLPGLPQQGAHIRSREGERFVF